MILFLKRASLGLCLLLALFVFSSKPVSATRLIDESFEKIGYEESGWVEAIGSGTTIDEDLAIEEDSAGLLPPRSGGEAVEITQTASTSNVTIKKDYGSAKNICNIRAYFNPKSISFSSPTTGDYVLTTGCRTAADGQTAAVIVYYDGSNYQFRVRYYDGSLKNYTSGYTFTANKWYRLNLKYDYSAKTVDFEVWNVTGATNYLDQSFSFSGTARQTQIVQAGLNNTSIAVGTITARVLYDLVAWDDSGATFPIVNETDHSFAISTIYPNSDNTQEWTRSSGSSNYQLVDDTTADDDATYVYVSSPTANKDDFYGIDPSTVSYDNRGKILSVRLFIRSKTEDKASRFKFAFKQVTGGATYFTETINNAADYRDHFYDFDLNPFTSKPWTWADLENVKIGYRAMTSANGGWTLGGRVTQVNVKVIHGSYTDRYIYPVTPVFAGVTTSGLKVLTRIARPQLVSNSSAGYIKVRYKASINCSTVDMGSGYSETSAVQVKTEYDWTNIFNITSLSTDTQYCFDFYASPDGSTNWRSLHDTFSKTYYSQCSTWPTTGNVTWMDYSDQHSYPDDRMADRVAAENPKFIISLGDLFTNCSADITCMRDMYKWMYSTSVSMRENVFDKIPFESINDDHDWYDNNSDKFVGKSISTGAAERNRIFRAYHEYRPTHDLPSSSKITGTTTHTVGDSLKDTGKTFTNDNVHWLANYGGAFVINTTDNTFAMVTGITDSNTLTLTADIFTSGESYEIYNNFARAFSYGNRARFVLWDLRSQRDIDNYLPGIDGMDGTFMASPTTLNTAKDSGAITSYSGNTITQTLQNFLSTVSVGDVIFNSTDNKWSKITQVNSNVQLTLSAQVFNGTEDFFIYESGASEGTNSKRHIQRNWGIDEVNNATEGWTFIITSSNFNRLAVRPNPDHDQWPDYDDYSADIKDVQRDYIASHITDVTDVVYISSNFHMAAIDDGTNTGYESYTGWAEMDAAYMGEAECVAGSWSEGCEAYQIGTAESGGSNTLTDTDKTWVTNSLAGLRIEITAGTGIGQVRDISSNTSTVLTVSVNWVTPPSSSSEYQVERINHYGMVEVTGSNIKLYARRVGDGSLAMLSGDNPFMVGALTNQWEQPLSDVITFSDTVSPKGIGKPLSDSLTLTDSSYRAIGFPKADSVTFSESIAKRPGNVFTDSITFSDAAAKSEGKGLSDSLALSDLPQKTVARYPADAVTFTDAISKSPNKKPSDTIILADSISSKSMGKGLSDTLNLVDVASKSVGKGLSDSVTFSDSFSKMSAFKKNPSDTVTLTDSYAFQQVKNLADTLSLLDQITTQFNPGVHNWVKSLSDILTLAESIAKVTGKPVSDSLTLSDSHGKATGKPLSDSMNFSDSQQAATGKGISDTVSFTDSASKASVKALADAIAMNDSFGRTVSFSRTSADTITLSDSLGIQAALIFADAISLAEQITTNLNPGSHEWVKSLDDAIALADAIASKTVSKSLADALSLVDIAQRAMTMAKADSITLADSPSKSVTKAQGDTITFADSYSKAVSKAVSDAVTLIDSMSRSVAFRRTNADTVTFSDSLRFQVALNFSETLSLVDSITTELNPGVHHWNMQFNDAIAFSDLIKKATGIIFNDSMAFSDAAAIGMTQRLMDTLTILDSLSRAVVFVRTLEDIFSLQDLIDIGQAIVEMGAEVPARLFLKTVPARSFGSTVPARRK